MSLEESNVHVQRQLYALLPGCGPRSLTTLPVLFERHPDQLAPPSFDASYTNLVC
jgi:hypothetical protein